MAARYWVGGTDTWNATAGSKWATSSGGAGGASNPTAADDVYFDGASGTPVVTMATGATCRSLDCNGYTGTLVMTGLTFLIGDGTAGAGNIALRLSAGMTFTAGSNAQFDFRSTSGTQQSITLNGKLGTHGGSAVSCGLNFNAAGSWILVDGFNISANILMTAGTFNSGNQNFTCAQFNPSGSNPRTVTLGSSQLLVTSSWIFSATTNLTLNANTSLITFSGGNVQLAMGGLTYYDVTLRHAGSTADTRFEPGGASFHDFTFTHNSTTGGITTNGNFTVTNNLTFTGSTHRITLRSTVPGTQRTITCNGTVSITNADFQDIVGAGSASWAGGTSVGDMGGNSGITFTGAVTRYWVHGASASYDWHTGGRWSTSSGGSVGASVPLAQDTVIFDANSFPASGKTVTTSGTNRMKLGTNVSFAAVTNNPTITISGNNDSGCYVFGDLTLAAGMTFTASTSNQIYLQGRSSNVLTCNGAALNVVVCFESGPSNNIILADALSTTGGIQVANRASSAGGMDAATNNVNVTALLVTMSTTGPVRRMLMGTGTWTITGTGNCFFLNSTTTTIDGGTAQIKFTDTSGSTKSCSIAGNTLYSIWVAIGSASTFAFTTAMTLNGELKFDPGTSIIFNPSTVYSARFWTISGTVGNLVTLNTSVPSLSYTFNKLGGGAISADYINLTRCTASPYTAFAGANSTNGGNNTNWLFQAGPVVDTDRRSPGGAVSGGHPFNF